MKKYKTTAAAGLGTLVGASLAMCAVYAYDTTPVVVAEESLVLTSPESDASETVCADTLAQTENDVLALEYSKATIADCGYVGCGGIF